MNPYFYLFTAGALSALGVCKWRRRNRRRKGVLGKPSDACQRNPHGLWMS